MEIIKIYDAKKGAEVTAGKIEKDCFIKKVKAKHYMRKYKGYGIDKKLLQKLYLTHREVTDIIIVCKTTKYKTKIKDWINHGTEDNFGHGEQYFLPVSTMTEI